MTPATAKRLAAVALAAGCAFFLSALKDASLRLPDSLAGAVAIEVSGHQVRWRNQPMRLGEYRVEGVKEGVEFSWSVEFFGVRGGSARQRLRFTVHDPQDEVREVECRSRSIEAWRKGWTVDLTNAFTPRLACGVRSQERLLRLVLGSRAGHGFRGALQHDGLGETVLTVRSLHKLEGTPLPLGEPAGYALARDGQDVAAVEVLNRGRIWLAADLDASSRADVASVAAALLFFKPEMNPQVELD